MDEKRELSIAIRELFIAICEELGIEKLVKWLACRLEDKDV